MSKTLNLVDRLLAQGRTYQQHGCARQALDTLSCLAGFRVLPDGVSQEVRRRLAELYLERRRYRQACRCLAVLLRQHPDNAEYHRLMATALKAREGGHWERAAEHYARALELDGEAHPEWLAEAGMLDVRLGRLDCGLARLRRAVELRPADPALLVKLVRALRWAGRGDEARDCLRAALFRNRLDARFQACWRDFQFRQAQQRQARERRTRSGAAGDSGPVLLPFVRVVGTGGDPSMRGTILRHDGGSPLKPPHHHNRLPEKRNLS